MKQKLRINRLLAGVFAAMCLSGVTAAQAQSNSFSAAVVKGVSADAVAAPYQALNVQSAPIPTDTRARVENAPAMGGLMGWAYGAGSGNCIGPSQSTAASGQVSVVGTGVGIGGGSGTTNLDWGCVIKRELEIADALCKGGSQKACADRDALYEMQPGIMALRAKMMPDYAKAQVTTPPEPKQQPAAKTEAQPQQTAGVRQPTNCVSDEYVARRTGSPMCK